MKLPFKVDLSSKVVAITGAGGVICGEFSKALAACGAKVALLDVNFEAAKKIADEIGENAIAVRCNCLDKNSIAEAKNIVEESFGKVNFLINGAGGNNPRATTDNETMTADTQNVKDFFHLDESGLRFVFDLNIMTAFLVTQVFAEDMVKTGGNIINVSSMNAYRPLTKIPAYSAAKAGISNLTQWLAVHFAPCNIRVNAIAPGFFVTNQNRNLLFDEKGAAHGAHCKDPGGYADEKVRRNFRSDGGAPVACGRFRKRIRHGNGDPRGRRIFRIQRRIIALGRITWKNICLSSLSATPRKQKKSCRDF